MPSFEDSAFQSFSAEGHTASMLELLGDSRLDPEGCGTIDDFITSVRQVAPLCKSVTELEWLAQMQMVASTAKTALPEGEFNGALTSRCLEAKFPQHTVDFPDCITSWVK